MPSVAHRLINMSSQKKRKKILKTKVIKPNLYHYPKNMG